MKRIFVTGGAGFIGSHTVDLLLEKNVHVVVFDNLVSGKLTNLNLFHPHLRVVQGDVLNYALLRKEMMGSDAVLHLAALSSVPASIDDPLHSLQVNTLGFLNVLQAIREINQPMRLVYASSAAVYGHATVLPCDDERVLTEPALSPYALQKAENERYADLYARLFGITSLGLRYFNVYGPRQDPSSPYSGVISKFMERYAAKQMLTIFGDGEQSRDFIYVTDVAKANWLALQSSYSGALNIATGVAETLRHLVSYLETVGGYAAKVHVVPARPGDIEKSFATVEKAARELDFRTTTDLQQGMKLLLSSTSGDAQHAKNS